MHPNYEFLLQSCQSMGIENPRVLDYGCGNGKTVEAGLGRNIDIYGVEAFSFGSGPSLKDELTKKELLNERVLELDGCAIPFEDEYFDIVISNQVFEHVVDLESALKEIGRVLKKKGVLLSLFPSREVIREGHCGILFAHRIPHSKFRFYWLLLWRSLGFGRLKRRRTRRAWARFFNEWLIQSVTYRTIRSIHKEFEREFMNLKHLEAEYVAFRLNHGFHGFIAKFVNKPLFKPAVGWLFTRWGGLVLEASKGEAPA